MEMADPALAVRAAAPAPVPGPDVRRRPPDRPRLRR
jgi:hypothetical protein